MNMGNWRSRQERARDQGHDKLTNLYFTHKSQPIFTHTGNVEDEGLEASQPAAEDKSIIKRENTPFSLIMGFYWPSKFHH